MNATNCSAGYYHVPASDSLCHELQGDHSSYPEGLLVTRSISLAHLTLPSGEWIIRAFSAAPNPLMPVANVHPIMEGRIVSPRQVRYNNRLVYGVRFWMDVESNLYEPRVKDQNLLRPHLLCAFQALQWDTGLFGVGHDQIRNMIRRVSGMCIRKDAGSPPDGLSDLSDYIAWALENLDKTKGDEG